MSQLPHPLSYLATWQNNTAFTFSADPFLTDGMNICHCWLIWLFRVLLYVCGVYMWVWEHVCLCTYMLRAEQDVGYHFVSFSILLLWYKVVTKLEVPPLFFWLGQLVRSVCISQCWAYRNTQSFVTFYMGSRDSNSGLHTCKATTLSLWAISLEFVRGGGGSGV